MPQLWVPIAPRAFLKYAACCSSNRPCIFGQPRISHANCDRQACCSHIHIKSTIYASDHRVATIVP